ncbi:MAG: aldehyde dehydrogenase family protein [Bradymonadia bacterium]
MNIKVSRDLTPEEIISRIPALVAGLRDTFNTGKTKTLQWRLEQLQALKKMCQDHEGAIAEALGQDLGKPYIEAFSTEIHYVVGEVDYIAKRLSKWMKPEKVSTPLVAQPGTSKIHREPLGVVLVIAPWNYPFQLAMAPLLGALAAGNCAVVKPSEVAPATSTLMADLLPKYLDTDAIAVVEGAVPETTALLAERFDHIFYTGNGTVGRIVMSAAAKHLTPVTLELGGKSPVYIDKGANLEVAAKRIAWGKFSNSGQTCVAPDYLLVHEAIYDRFIDQLKQTLHDFYGDDPQKSPDYGRVINTRHHARLMGLFDDKAGEIVTGGPDSADAEDRFIAPTVLKHTSPESAVMADEIFGPLLPTMSVPGPDEAVAFINARPKPLAMYVFASDKGISQQMIDRTSAGGGAINHCMMHLAVPGLPFGGVGESGMGAYHGKASFEVFSHRRSVLSKPTAIDPSLLYPPYDEKKVKWIKRLL